MILLFMVEYLQQASCKVRLVFNGYVTSNRNSKGRCRLGVVELYLFYSILIEKMLLRIMNQWWSSWNVPVDQFISMAFRFSLCLLMIINRLARNFEKSFVIAEHLLTHIMKLIINLWFPPSMLFHNLFSFQVVTVHNCIQYHPMILDSIESSLGKWIKR